MTIVDFTEYMSFILHARKGEKTGMTMLSAKTLTVTGEHIGTVTSTEHRGFHTFLLLNIRNLA